jgi:2-oxoglutarate dehydrogenase E2 component (dihydrolipoamide succinyltransferase)
MSVEVKVPQLAESISEAVLVEWLRDDGTTVRTDEPIVTLETDKAAVEIAAQESGVLRHVKNVGDRVEVGETLARIEPAMKEEPVGAGTSPAPRASASADATAKLVTSAASGEPAAPGNPAVSSSAATGTAPSPSAPPAAPAESQAGDGSKSASSRPADRRGVGSRSERGAAGPAAPTDGGGRSLTADRAHTEPSGEPKPSEGRAETAQRGSDAKSAPPSDAVETPAPETAPARADADERVVPMSRIRQRIAERLVRAQQTAAILTTFNEIDMSAVLALRARYKERFEARHGVRLGLMSFFTRACVFALGEIPELNAEIRGSDIVYKQRVHLGVAVGTDRGVVVPVVRGADRLSYAEIEREIGRLAERARENSLTLTELTGGTFTLSNGGVYGSLLSTPILNPPQSGILGMHKIEKRPIAADDQVVIRPMMYVALSYDHRIVDGEQAVTFLVHVKERLENPDRMMLDV